MSSRAHNGPPKRRPPKPKKGSVREAGLGPDFAVRVWCSFKQVGATAAGFLHDINPSTVYLYAREVDADPVLLERARAALAEQQQATERRNAELIDAAREALLARIREGRVVSKHLVALVGLTVPSGAPKGGARPGSSLEVPAILARPREGTDDDVAPGADAPPPDDEEAAGEG